MMIQCDVCERDEASVFCIADEAALCSACDHRVHHANKLAGKHQRYSLHHLTPKQAPRCDLCQDRRAFLFCHQERAILCTDCDFQIHKANEHTQKHTRFLLTGVKLSPAAALYSRSQSSPESQSSDVVPTINSGEKIVLVSKADGTPSNSKSTTAESTDVPAPVPCDDVYGLVPGSTISEYLMEMLPGWHVEDFLDSSFLSPFGFCKSGGHDLMPLWDADLESNMNSFPTEPLGFWVPQVDHPFDQSQIRAKENNEQAKEITTDRNISKASRKLSEDGSFLVPHITSSLSVSK